MSLVGFAARNHPQQETDDGVDDRALPPAVFAKWHDRFQFTIDVAASDANAKLPRYYTRATNGLEQSWVGERVYCNPPFSNIAPWVKKAWAEVGAPLIVMLLPANRTEQRWWHELIESKRDRGGVRAAFGIPAGPAEIPLPWRNRHQEEQPPTLRVLPAYLGA